MSKKNLMLPILAVIVGIAASAFSTVNINQHSNSDPYWYKVDPATHEVVQIIGQTSQSTAENISQCANTSTELCAYGYTTNPGYSVGDVAAQGDESFNKTAQ